VLLIGYGSIGKRHEEVLLSFQDSETIDIVTKQSLNSKITYRTLQEVEKLESYDYFIIASETNKHYEQLKYLDDRVQNKRIFCEKPLFEKYKDLNIINNSVYVGYVLRFHPLLEKLKELLSNDTILNINVQCGQYLPTWRPDSDYRESYSAKQEEGGGVLLDLSHEIDYVQYLCGKMIEIKSYQVKVSDLKINSDDLTTFIGKTEKSVLVNVSIDYISKITHRRMILNTLNYTYELDFIHNTLLQKDKFGEEKIFEYENLERNSMFRKMHQSILDNQDDSCSYQEGLDTMHTIAMIQEQNR
jgi:CMP-N,N'-diacetyllegionaminic acid synthase